MSETDAIHVALKFANEINRHDVDALTSLMSVDHLFVDALGQEVHGKEKLREAWTAYFELFPDYHIDIRESFQSGQVIALFGTASGTYAVNGELPARNRWKIPAAWRAIIEHDRVAHWQVFADNEPVWKIMGVKRY